MSVFNRRLAIIVHDLFMVALAWMLAYLVRYNFLLNHGEWTVLGQSLVMVTVVQGLVSWRFGLYRGVWRFASIPDLWNIIRAVFLGALAASLVLFLVNRLENIPRSTLLLYPLFATFLLGAPRALYRMWKDHDLSFQKVGARRKVLIIGAGRAGEMLARDMRRDDDYLPVGFLDDQPRLRGAKIYGLPVLGRIDDLPRIVASLAVDVVIIAIPSANAAQMQRVVEQCEQAGVMFRTLPRLGSMFSTQPTMREVREVAIEDLLGREQVALDWRRISEALVGKTVLVTGAGGSIGSELCRQIARLGPGKLVAFERSEFNLYNIELELRRGFPDLILAAQLGDVTDPAAVDHVLTTHHPQVVFHAAAYKHVPLLQGQPREAVRNNVLGTRTMVLAAESHGCDTFVMISTDKAVKPTNVMGATKRVAELLCQALSRRSAMRLITVRFGNVLGSAGSVVPLFQKQIAAGGPVTVTHPEITRYFMTIPEACQLIMQAGVMGRGGEIFVLDMGQPVKISYLAEQMIRLSGKAPGKDIKIEFTGLRPGEKLYEELFYEQERLNPTGHKKILLAQSAPVDWERLTRLVDTLGEAGERYDEDGLRLLLNELVPEMVEAEIKERSVSEGDDSNVVRLNRYNA
ncbi:MAG: nucleoside-diphosphate sugar epimerase/dehydratase [Gammaproteobacteria bacterium]